MQKSIIHIKNLDSFANRIDAEYYHPRYLREDGFITRHQIIELKKIAYLTDGQHGYHEVDPSSNIILLTARNAGEWLVNKTDAVRLAKWVDDKNQRSSLKENDLLISTRGTLGLCGIVKSEVLPANIDQDVIRIFCQNYDKVIPHYLLVYLNSGYGQDWIKRNASGMVQQGIPILKLKEMPIPLLDKIFQEILLTIVEKTHQLITNSNLLLDTATAKLQAEIGLTNWKPIKTKTFRKNYGDVTKSNRIDSEHYQPKYDEIIKRINSLSEKITSVKDKFTHVSAPINEAKDEYNYIEIGDINTSTGEAHHKKLKTTELPANAKIHVRKDDLLISKVRPYRGAVSIIQDKLEDLIVSSAFTVLREKQNYKKEVLQILLRSMPYKELMMKWNVGTSYPVIRDRNILDLPIPQINDEMQIEIKKMVEEAYQKRKLSKQLIEIAKKGVEKAIEENEVAAEAWINEALHKIGIEL